MKPGPTNPNLGPARNLNYLPTSPLEVEGIRGTSRDSLSGLTIVAFPDGRWEAFDVESGERSEFVGWLRRQGFRLQRSLVYTAVPADRFDEQDELLREAYNAIPINPTIPGLILGRHT